MSVYVDALIPCQPNGQWRWAESCHLFADTIQELHQFAGNVGLRREWFQNRADFPHYDLHPARRDLAIVEGAIPLGRRQSVAKIIELRDTWAKEGRYQP